MKNIHPNIYLLLIATTFVFFRVIEALVPKNYQFGITTIDILLFLILVYGWCKSHVEYSKIVEPKGSTFLCVLIPPIGVPVYFFRAFGVKPGFIKSILSCLYFVLIVKITETALSFIS